MSRSIGLVLRAALSLGLVAVVVWWVGPSQLRESLAGASPGWVLVVIGLHTGDRLLMSYKWHRLLRVRQLPVGLGEAVRAYYVSSFAGVFLPMTVGADLVRVAAMRDSRVPSRTVIASIALERGLGALSQAVFCALSLGLIVALRLDADVSVGWLGAAVAALLVLLTTLLPLSFRLASELAARLGDRPGIGGKLAGLAAEYADWRAHPREIWVFLALTFLEGFFPIVTYLAAARALGVETSLIEMTALVPLVYLLARLPVSVAGIGVEQTSFVVAAATVLGMAAANAAAISFLVSPITLLIALLPGALAYVHVRRQSR
jgi:uncharacterized membrane protein YbhN (UPF0104 family)